MSDMTWRELEGLIFDMPEVNKDSPVNIWDYATGMAWTGIDFSCYDADEFPNENNFYSLSINSEKEPYSRL